LDLDGVQQYRFDSCPDLNIQVALYLCDSCNNVGSTPSLDTINKASLGVTQNEYEAAVMQRLASPYYVERCGFESHRGAYDIR